LYALPKWGKYKVKQEVVVLEDGSSTNSLVKVALNDLEKWEQNHDEAGRAVISGVRVETKNNGQSGQV
jgi:hypothetical protein